MVLIKFIKIIVFHAEVDALNNLKNQNKLHTFFKINGIKWNYKYKYKMYVFRTSLSENFLISKPCNNCIKYIKKFNISTIYYTI